MKKVVLGMMVLTCVAANAQVYKCPAEDAGINLTNAELRIGERGTSSSMHGDVDQVANGTNIRFELTGEATRWLVCQYGGRHVEGTAISSPAVIGGRETWIQLDPMITACDLAIRRKHGSAGSTSVWSAAATCKRKEPPPPDLV